MLDVAQNTARLNSLIGRYYTAEFQLEEKTESKLQLGQQAADSTIDKNKNALALMDKYDALEARLAESTKDVEICDGIKMDLSNKASLPSKDQFWAKWDEANKKPTAENHPELYGKVDENNPQFSVDTLMNDSVVQEIATARVDATNPYPDGIGQDPGDPGAEPTQAQFTTGSGSTATVDTTAYDNAKAEWQKKKDAKTEYDKKKAAMDEWNSNYAANVQKEARNYVTNEGYQQDKIKAENNQRAEALKEAQDDWQRSRITAGNMFDAAVGVAKGDADAISKAKAREQERADLEFNISQKQISQKESLLDQEIQQLQAEVTAIKTEIDSLKQERNSNVQSDFKLFG